MTKRHRAANRETDAYTLKDDLNLFCRSQLLQAATGVVDQGGALFSFIFQLFVCYFFLFCFYFLARFVEHALHNVCVSHAAADQ